MMASRSTTKSFSLTLKLNTSPVDERILQERFFKAFLMYNRLVEHAQKRLRGLRQDKHYRTLMQEYLSVKGGTPKAKEERARLGKCLSSVRMEYGLSEYQFHAWIVTQQHRYKAFIDANTAQKVASSVWRSVEDVLFRKGKTIHFKKFENFLSVEGKDNSCGIRFRGGHLCWLGLEIQPRIRKDDSYAREALTHRVKYCRIVRKPMGTTYHYYLQLVLDGIPPQKHPFLTDGRVGVDPGVSTEAVVSERGCLLEELSPERKDISKEIRRIQRRMDRSRRASNPGNYNPDGTLKDRRSRRKWKYSRHYKDDHMRLKTLRRRNAATAKQSEECLADRVLCFYGSDIHTEKMSYQALAAKAKKDIINPATGKHRSRKRFGTSIAGHAPSRFLDILDRKVHYLGKKVDFVDTWSFKASQYDHVTDTYTKIPLSARWKQVGGHTVQRDLYSAFLLMNAASKTSVDRNLCIQTFHQFLVDHDACMNGLKKSGTHKPATFGT